MKSRLLWSCNRCGKILRIWRIRCPHCYTPAISWLQIFAVIAFAATAVFIVKMLN